MCVLRERAIMDCYTLVLGLTFALSFLYIIAKLCSGGSKKLPPGPSPWPIIGNLHLLGAKPHVSLANLAKVYGPIMSLKFGQITTVVISSSSMAKQVLKNQDQAFSTRFIPNALQAHDHYQFSMAWLPVCPQWRTLRRILNTNIFSSNRLDANQHLRSQKVKELIAYCAKCSQEAKAVDIGQVAFKTNLNLLYNTLFSKDLADPFSDSKVELKEVIWGIMAEVGKPNLVDFFPIFEKTDLQGIRHRTTIYFGKLFKLFDGLINERLEEKRRFHSERNDVLEAFLNINEENPKEISHNHIKSMFLDLFGAGTDTTTSTLEWAIAEILKQPKIMKKAQAELAEIIGKGKPIEEVDVSRLPYLQCIIKETLRMHPPVPLLIPRKVEQDIKLYDYIIPKGSQDLFVAAMDTTTSTVEWAMTKVLTQPEIMKKAQVELAEIIGKGKSIKETDVSRLPYLQCIIKETLRMHPPVPLLVPHKVEQDVELCGYIIPKDSQVLVIVWAIGRDFTFWEDPLMFKPERFWRSDLDIRGQDVELIPFGAGRRICPGFPLALRMVAIILGSLLNSFNWKLEADNGPKDLDLEEKFGITLAKAHPLRAIPSPL